MWNIPCRVAVCLAFLNFGCPTIAVAADEPPKPAEMAGYLLVPHEKVDKKYNAGFSLYVAAWPLLKNYPGQEFQSGLFGTWMFAQFDGKAPKDHYSDIEGGLGWWRDCCRTRPCWRTSGPAPSSSANACRTWPEPAVLAQRAPRRPPFPSTKASTANP